jgi:hypothetical protein
MIVTLIDGDVRERSTDAARDYVLATRNRLQAELESYGPQVRARRSYQHLEHSISEGELARMWPHADLTLVLTE